VRGRYLGIFETMRCERSIPPEALAESRHSHGMGVDSFRGRLVCRTGLQGSAKIRMASSQVVGIGLGARLPVYPALCGFGAHAVVADLAARHEIEAAPAIAEILCNKSDASK
jgi:hypothetical protein